MDVVLADGGASDGGAGGTAALATVALATAGPRPVAAAARAPDLPRLRGGRLRDDGGRRRQ
jgi:hypothetical protein